MTNHFRSLLMNVTAVGDGSPLEPYTAYDLHLDKNYSALDLPLDLQELHDVLYPTNDIEVKRRLTHIYMSVITACGLEPAMLALDPRVTYDITRNQDFFKVRTCSTGYPSSYSAFASGCHVRVFNNEFTPVDSQQAFDYRVVITQISNTNQVQLEYGYDSLETIPGSPVTLTFTDGFSQVVPVYNPALPTNLMFEFSIHSPTSFTGTSDKAWDVALTVPNEKILTSQFAALAAMHGKVTSAFAKYQGSPGTANYDSLWEKHHNPAYRLAGFLVGLVYRMNTLYFA